MIEKKQQFVNKLANNLQNSYFKAINHMIKDNLENNQCLNKFLEEYDIQTRNHHIYDLSSPNYRKKFNNQLQILIYDYIYLYLIYTLILY
jgi:hypothetical protein